MAIISDRLAVTALKQKFKKLSLEEKGIVFDLKESISSAWEEDWLLNLIAEPRFTERVTIEDALAYCEFLSACKQGSIYMCIVKCDGFAQANKNVLENERILNSSGVGAITNVTDESDGSDGIFICESLKLIKLTASGDEPVEENDFIEVKNEQFQVEIGSLSISKFWGLLATEGKICRLPYRAKLLEAVVKDLSGGNKGLTAFFYNKNPPKIGKL